MVWSTQMCLWSLEMVRLFQEAGMTEGSLVKTEDKGPMSFGYPRIP